MALRIRAAFVLWIVGASGHALAQARPATPHPSAALYRLARRPELPRAAALLTQALARLREAGRSAPGEWQTLCERTSHMHLRADNLAAHDGRRRALEALLRQALEARALLDDALARIDAALLLAPHDAEIHYVRARTLELWEEPLALDSCDVRRRDRAAIASLRRVMELDPTFEASDSSFQLGVLLTRAHEFDAAAQAYARAAQLSLDEREVSVTYANLAEVTMLAGDPAAALPAYQHAIELSHGGREYTLAMYGSAVALDRLGEHAAALQAAEKAAQTDRQTLDTLSSDGVFFEPSYERHYYEGVGNEALSHLTSAPELRQDALETALAGYRAFIASAPEGDPYRSTAQDDVARVERELQGLKDEAPLPPLTTKRAKARSRPHAAK